MPFILPQPGDLVAIPSDEEIAAVLSGRFGAVKTKPIAFAASPSSVLGSVQDAIEDGTIELDNTRAAIRTAQLVIRPAAIPSDFNPITDFFVVAQDVWFEGLGYYRFQLGVFRLDFPSETHTENDNELWNVAAIDMTVSLIEQNFSLPVTFVAGSSVTDDIIELLVAANAQSYSIPPSPLVLQVDKVWAPGVSVLEAINDLLENINYFPLWVDVFGTYRTREMIDPSSEAVSVTYSTEAESRMIIPPFGRNYQIAAQPNRVVVKRSNPLTGSIASEAVNVDPFSRVSTVSRGITKTREDSLDDMYDESVATAIAEVRVRYAAGNGVVGSLSTFPDYRRAEHEAYSLTIETRIEQELWRVVGWRMPLTPGGIMTHSLRPAASIAITSGSVY